MAAVRQHRELLTCGSRRPREPRCHRADGGGLPPPHACARLSEGWSTSERWAASYPRSMNISNHASRRGTGARLAVADHEWKGCRMRYRCSRGSNCPEPLAPAQAVPLVARSLMNSTVTDRVDDVTVSVPNFNAALGVAAMSATRTSTCS